MDELFPKFSCGGICGKATRDTYVHTQDVCILILKNVEFTTSELKKEIKLFEYLKRTCYMLSGTYKNMQFLVRNGT